MRRRRRKPPSPTRSSVMTSIRLSSNELLPVLAPQVGHHGDERAGDGEAGLDGIVHLEDLQLELAPEEVKDLGDVGDVAPAQLDAVPARDELEDASPEIRTLFGHQSGGPLVGVEDVPG